MQETKTDEHTAILLPNRAVNEWALTFLPELDIQVEAKNEEFGGRTITQSGCRTRISLKINTAYEIRSNHGIENSRR